MKEPIAIGQILEVNDTINLVDSNNSYIVFMALNRYNVPIGRITCENLKHFDESAKPVDITKIVYLGNYQYGVKQLTEPFDEFNRLGVTEQANVINRMCYVMSQPDDEL